MHLGCNNNYNNNRRRERAYLSFHHFLFAYIYPRNQGIKSPQSLSAHTRWNNPRAQEPGEKSRQFCLCFLSLPSPSIVTSTFPFVFLFPFQSSHIDIVEFLLYQLSISLNFLVFLMNFVNLFIIYDFQQFFLCISFKFHLVVLGFHVSDLRMVSRRS